MRIAQTCVAGAALVLLSSQASADVSGRYESTDKKPVINMEMTVETNDAGDVRMQMAGVPNYYLLKSGQLYSVSRGADGPVVVRVADMLAMQASTLRKMGVADPFKDAAKMPHMEFAAMGPEKVGPWQGTAYGLKSDSGKIGPYAAFVLSDDPRIAPLGKGIAKLQSSMGNVVPALGQLGQDFMQFLSKGTPVRMIRIELTDVSYDPISPDRFALPAPPEPLEQLEAQSEPFPDPPTLPPRKH